MITFDQVRLESLQSYFQLTSLLKPKAAELCLHITREAIFPSFIGQRGNLATGAFLGSTALDI